MILRDYQLAAIGSVYDHFGRGGSAPLVVAPTGSGKSLILAGLIQSILRETPEERVLVLTHVRELVAQDASQILAVWPEAPVGVYSAGMGRREMKQITVASIQSIYKREEFWGAFGLVIIDECFVAGTKISTPKGMIDIDHMRCGDVVYTASGIGTIEAVSIRPAKEIFTVEFDDGSHVRCTAKHPFFTEQGWTEAANLEKGIGVFCAKSVCSLWENVSSLADGKYRRFDEECNERSFVEQAKVLLTILCQEITQPHEHECRSRQNARNIKENPASTYQTWRERALTTLAAASPSACFGRGVGSGGGRYYRSSPPRLSASLQNRFGKRDVNDRDRSRRWQPLFSGEAGAGQKEDGFPHLKRVVSISSIKHESSVPVFNLHVSGHPSYFANNSLVHNCHLIPNNSTGMYSSFLIASNRVNPDVRLVGLTATPYRLQSGMLHEGEGAMFDGISYDISVSALIKDGYLSHLTCKHGADVDLSGVRKTAGEYNLADLGEAMSAMELVDQHCETIVARCEGRRAVLVFGVTVAHAEAVCEALKARGVPSAVVSGDMPAAERDGVIGAFKRGELRALVNCQVLTTGFDYPGIDAVVMLRPTLSPGLYVQMAGRGLRVAPGKVDCLVVDFGGNVMRHGFVDNVQPPRRKGRGQAPIKRCPQCSGLIPLGVNVCPQCEHVFPLREGVRKSMGQVYEGPMLSVDAASVLMKVGRVDYRRHMSKSGNLTMRVTYHAGLRQVSEYVCLEHEGFALHRAHQWWSERSGVAVPASVEDAVGMSGELRVPHYLTVNFAGKYPEIVSFGF